GDARRWGHHQVVTVIGGGAPRSVPRFIAAVTVIRSSASYSCRVHDGRVVGSGLTSPAPGCRQRGTAANPPPPVPAGCRRRRSRSTPPSCGAGTSAGSATGPQPWHPVPSEVGTMVTARTWWMSRVGNEGWAPPQGTSPAQIDQGHPVGRVTRKTLVAGLTWID